MNDIGRQELGEIIRRERVKIPLTLQQLSAMSGVSPSHLGRTERGERFPSANVLKRIAKPLGFDEDELFILAGYLSPQQDAVSDTLESYNTGQLDPYVAKILAKETVEVQLAIVGLVGMLKTISKSLSKETAS